VRGGEIAAQVLDPTQPMNELIRRASNDRQQSGEEVARTKSYWLAGTRLRILAGPADTGGRYDIVDGWFPAGAKIPWHLHRRSSEQIYVLDGEFTVWRGGCKAVLRPGENLFIPDATAHALSVIGVGPGRALIVTAPSGFARLITEAGTPDDESGMPPSAATDMERLLRVAAELGDEFFGPPGPLPDDITTLPRPNPAGNGAAVPAPLG
jgi:quercetin dioxygenase-like cupin family protein